MTVFDSTATAIGADEDEEDEDEVGSFSSATGASEACSASTRAS